ICNKNGTRPMPSSGPAATITGSAPRRSARASTATNAATPTNQNTQRSVRSSVFCKQQQCDPVWRRRHGNVVTGLAQIGTLRIAPRGHGGGCLMGGGLRGGRGNRRHPPATLVFLAWSGERRRHAEQAAPRRARSRRRPVVLSGRRTAEICCRRGV